MARTRTISFKKIPPLRIDRSFIERIGTILESDIQQRILEGKVKAEKEIAERTKKEPGVLDVELKSFIESRHYPSYSLEYTIHTGTESFEFESYKDILETTLLSDDVEKFSIRVSHSDKSYVDVLVRFARESPTIGSKLSSRNEEKLLKFKEELQNLFQSKKLPWWPLYIPLFGLPAAVIPIMVLSSYVTFKLFLLAVPMFNENIKTLLMYPALLAWFLIFYFLVSLTSRLYPLNSFELSDYSHHSLSRTALTGLCLAIAGSLLYDGIKFIS
jgi:hypothetical protein